MRLKNSLGLGLALGLSTVLVTGCGGSDNSTPAPANPVVTEFIVIPSGGSSSVSVKRVNQNGTTTDVGNTNTGTTPVMVKTHPSAPFVYVANGTDDTISAFSMGTNGTLTEIAGSPFATTGGLRTLGIHPAGGFLYAAGTNQVSTFAVAQNGALSNRVDTALPNGSASTAPMVFYTNPSAQELLVIASGTGANASLNHFQVNANGSLSAGGSIQSVGTSFDGLTTHPNGFLVATRETANANESQVVSFNISNQALPVETAAVNLAFDSGGVVGGNNGNLYVGSDSSNQVAGFSLNQNGAFTALSGSPFAIDHVSNFVALDRTQTLLFAVSNLPAAVSAFGFNGNGGLIKADGSPFSGGLVAPFLPDFVVFTN